VGLTSKYLRYPTDTIEANAYTKQGFHINPIPTSCPIYIHMCPVFLVPCGTVQVTVRYRTHKGTSFLGDRYPYDFFLLQYVLSVVSAFVSEFVTYPLDLTKTRLQIQVRYLQTVE